MSAENAVTLDEVLVTATRFARSATDYAGSATRLTRADIETRGANHYADLLNLVAGVQLQRGSGQEALMAIRSPVLTGAGACGAFLILEDGMPLRPAGFCNVNDLFEVNTEQAQAIEVLRGPASALYGANALHGIVNILSRDQAGLGKPGIGLRWGDLDLQQLSAEWRNATSSATEIGAYGLWRHDGGFRSDSGSDEGKLNLLVRRASSGGVWTWRAAGTVLNQETAGFIRGLNSYRDTRVASSNANPEAFRDAWSLRSSLKYERESCEGCATTGYAMLRASGMKFLQHFLLGKPLEENSQRSVAAGMHWRRPVDGNGPWAGDTWQFGIDAGHMEMRLAQSQSGPTNEGTAAARAIRPAGNHYDYDVAGTTLAVSAAYEHSISTRLAMSAQLHFENTRYDYDNRLAAGNLDDRSVSCGFGGCLYNRPADRRDSFRDISARLEWRLEFLPNKSLFAALARGFRPPETSELYRLQRGQDVATLDSENLQGLEVGVRFQTDHWRTTLAIYAQEKNNVLLRDANGFNIEGGRTDHAGLEYEFSGQLGTHWFAVVAGSWAQHQYAFDRVIEGGETVVSGTEIDTAPRHLAHVQLGWRGPRGVDAQLELSYVGKYNVDAGGANQYPGHVVANLATLWRISAGHLLRLRLDNLFDRRYADRADFAQGDYRYFPAAGRHLMLEYVWDRH